MKKTEALNKFTRAVHRFGLQCRKHAPEALAVAGTVGVVASTVMACKATTKVNEIVEDTKAELDKIHTAGERLEAGEVLHTPDGEYTIEDNKKDLVITYAKAAGKFVKLYGPSIALGTLSLTCLLSSNNILKKRNVALAAAYTAVDKGFKEYRGRVVERFGKELDYELRHNIKAQEVKEIVTDENGNETEVTKVVNTVDKKKLSDYAKFFDEYCTGWCKNAELNLFTLKQQQAWANQRLQEQGYLFLNEVYESLGIPKTAAGQIVGWVWNDHDQYNDNYIDFGIYDASNENARDFVNGRERVFIIDPNVQGPILDLI